MWLNLVQTTDNYIIIDASGPEEKFGKDYFSLASAALFPFQKFIFLRQPSGRRKKRCQFFWLTPFFLRPPSGHKKRCQQKTLTLFRVSVLD